MMERSSQLIILEVTAAIERGLELGRASHMGPSITHDKLHRTDTIAREPQAFEELQRKEGKQLTLVANHEGIAMKEQVHG
jgi:hypothetical protein